MTCDDLRRKHEAMPEVLPPGPLQDDWHAFAEHMSGCQRCSNWYLERRVRKRGADPSHFPCVHIAERVTFRCDQHDDPWECPDYVLVYNAKFDEYGIPVRDGGTSTINIDFCPWCGLKLPPSRRDQWFETLRGKGFEDPWSDEIPSEFESDAWWRRP